jgi:hypothetical protein
MVLGEVVLVEGLGREAGYIVKISKSRHCSSSRTMPNAQKRGRTGSSAIAGSSRVVVRDGGVVFSGRNGELELVALRSPYTPRN